MNLYLGEPHERGRITWLQQQTNIRQSQDDHTNQKIEKVQEILNISVDIKMTVSKDSNGRESQ